MKHKRLCKRKISKFAGNKANHQGVLNYADHINAGTDETDINSSEESDSEDGISLCSSTESDEDSDSDEVGWIQEKMSNAYGIKAKSRKKCSSKKAENVKGNKKEKDFVNCYGRAKPKEHASRKRKKSKTRCQEPQYCKKELKIALEVIKKVMKMEEAEPFNVPVDPMASGKHEYFDVKNTPMDFSTICSNIESRVKYTNAKDVLKDVEIIWENCYTYNEKGELILILMKRVKKKFMKYWTAACLYVEHGRKTKEDAHQLHPTDSDMTSSRHDPRRQLGSMIGNSAQMQPDNSLPRRLQLQLPSSCCSHPYQSPQPQPSATQPQSCQFRADCGSTGKLYMPRSLDESQFTSSLCQLQQHQSSYEQPHNSQSTGQVNYSQLQFGQDIGAVGYTRLPPHTNPAVKHYENMPQCLGNSMISSRFHSQPQQLQLSNNQPNHLQKQSQPQPSPLQADEDVDSSEENSSLQLPRNHTIAHSNNLPKCPADPMVIKPTQLQFQKPTPSPNNPSELQANQESFGKPQPSQPRASIHTDCADSPTRDGKRTHKCEVNPTAQSPAQPQQPSRSILQPYKLPQLIQRKRRGRGPAQCLFLRKIPEGERIKVPINNLGEPIGPASTKLGSFLGIIARDGHMAPLIYVNWKAVPKEAKEEMWKCVQSRFIIDTIGKDWVLKSLSRKWRSWKSELKENRYYPHQTDEDRLKDRDPRVLPDQWPVLISFWSSEKGKMLSTINKATRAKQSGRKSYARIREEERTKRQNGEEPTEEELYILTHTNNKTGQPVNEKSASKNAQLEEQRKQKKSLKDSGDLDDIYRQEMVEERNGREDHDDHTKMASEGRKSANKEVSMVLKKIEAMEQKYAQMETLIARLTSSMERFLDEKCISRAASPSKTSGAKQVPKTSDALEDSPQLQLNSASSSDEVPFVA